jgi:hypothetical protein
MLYGNTPKALRKVALAGLVFTALLYLLFAVAAFVRGGWAGVPKAFTPPIGLIPLAVGGVLPLVVAPTVLFQIRVAQGKVQHLFLGGRVLSENFIQQLDAIDLGRGPWAVVLHFRDGRRIRFFGAHLGECQRLCDDLAKLADQEITVRRGRGIPQ